MADIFISYSREDRDWVSKLADALQAEGFTVWWDWDLLVGKRYRETIETELQTCKATVVVWSTHSIKSDFVRDEAEEGQQRNILVPILKESVRPPAGFRQLQTADFTTWTGGATHAEYQRMMKGLSHLIGRPAKSAEDHGDAAHGGPPPEVAPAPIVPPQPTQPVPVAEPAAAPIVQAKAPEPPPPVHKPVVAAAALPVVPKKSMPVIGYIAIGGVALVALIVVVSFVMAQFTPAPKSKPATILPAVHGPATSTGGTTATPPATPPTNPANTGDSGGDEAGNTHSSSPHGGSGTVAPATPEQPSSGGDSGDGGQDVGQSH